MSLVPVKPEANPLFDKREVKRAREIADLVVAGMVSKGVR